MNALLHRARGQTPMPPAPDQESPASVMNRWIRQQASVNSFKVNTETGQVGPAYGDD